jgi:protein SCO1
MKRWWLWGGMGGVGIVIAVMVWISIQPYNYHGTLIVPAQAAPDFNLTGPGGSTFSLTQLQGKISLIFFGYTYCPDVCPATMAEMRQVLGELGAAAANVRVLLVTVDPQRDSADRLSQYLKPFGDGFVGLSGAEAQLATVWQAYGVTRIIRPVASNPDLYTIDHTARLYLVDKQGRLRITYSYGTDPEGIRQDVQAFLKEN